jgi:type IV pilus assembly protein PilM
MAEGKNLVGVDIGSNAIKVVQLKEAKQRYQVIRYGFAPLPPQTIIDGHVMNPGVVTETIARLFQDQKIAQKEVAIGLYGQSVIVRKITVPLMTPDELEQQIGWEAEQHIPFDIKVVSVDYEVLRRREDTGQMEVLLVAAKRDEINDYASILRDAKLKPTVVDINAFTVQNIFETQQGLPPEGSLALINVGAAVTSLNIIAGGASAFSREITNAGNAVTEEIQRQINVPYDQAEAYKRGGGPSEIVPQEVHQVIANACEGLAGEVQRSLDFFLATSGEREINKIFVCGGSAYLAPLLSAIERRARVPVAMFDPLAHVTCDKSYVNEQDLRSKASQFVVAMGLSLRKDKEKRAA